VFRIAGQVDANDTGEVGGLFPLRWRRKKLGIKSRVWWYDRIKHPLRVRIVAVER
jgi:hypothetical protein